MVWTIQTIEGKRCVQVSIDKHDGMKWWDSAFEGHEKINTRKIEPENSKLSDLDGDTRSTVEKMMVDQQRKQQGLPSFEDEQKQSKLQEFMAQHPEMDFSNAKFN